jgi:hypothetical protein
MTKGLNDDIMIPTIIKRISKFKHVSCLDIGSYDAAQRGTIWDIEY